MADEQKSVLLNVEIHAEDALKAYGDLQTEIAKLRAEQSQLDKSNASQRDSWIALDQQIKALTSRARDYQKEIQNNIKAEYEQQGSLQQLKAKLSLATAEYNKMSQAERDTSAGKAKAQEVADLTEKLNRAEQAVGNFHRQVGNYAVAGESLKSQLKELTAEIADMIAQGDTQSAKFQELVEKAGEYKDAIADAKEAISNAASDTRMFDTLTDLGNVMSAGMLIAGQFGDALGLNAEQQQKLQAVSQKLMTVMTALNALKTIQNKLQVQGNISQALGTAETTAATAASTGFSVAQMASAAATGVATTATAAWNAVLNTNPIILIVSAIAGLVLGINALCNAMSDEESEEERAARLKEENNAAMERANKLIDQQKQKLSALSKSHDEQIELMRAKGATDVEVHKAQVANLKSEIKATEDAIKANKLLLQSEIDRLIASGQVQRNGNTLIGDADVIKNIRQIQQAGADLESQLHDLNHAMDVEVAQFDTDQRKASESARRESANRARTRQDEIKKAEEQRKKDEENAKKVEEAKAKTTAEIQKMASDMAIANIEDETERAVAQRKAQGEQEIAQLKNRLANDQTLTTEAHDQLAQIIKDKETQLQADLDKIRSDKKDADHDEILSKYGLDDPETMAEQLDELKTALDKGIIDQEEYQSAVDKLHKDAQEQHDSLLSDIGVIEKPDDLQNQLSQLQSALDAGLISEEEYAQAVAKLYSDMALAKAQSVVDMSQQVMSIADTINGAIEEQENAELDRYKEQNDEKKEQLEERLDAGLITQEDYDAQVEALDEEQAQKEKDLQLKQAKRQKAMAIMNATLNAAAAIIASLAQSPVAYGPIPNPAGIASLALATAMGVAQIAAAVATPLPTAGRGMMISGKPHSQGGEIINAEGGEAIINKKATRRYLPLLSAINQSTGGVPLYGNGGVVGSAVDNAMANVIDYGKLAAACSAMDVQVAVTDINKGQSDMARIEQRKNY